MATDIGIAQTAMVLAGLIPIEAFGQEGADSYELLYKTKRNDFLSRHPWKFTVKREQLSLLNETPIAEWEFVFALPPDRQLPPETIWNSADPRMPAYKRFEISENRLYSDTDTLWAKYVYNVDEGKWPAYFVAFVEMAMAHAYALAFTENKDKQRELSNQAWGMVQEGGLGGLFAVARRADGRFNPSRSLIVNQGPLLAARLGAR